MTRIAFWGRRRGDEPEWPVLATVGVALLLGLLIAYIVTGRTSTARVDGMSVAYPAEWTGQREPDALFSVSDRGRSGVFAPRLSLNEAAKTDLLPREGELSQAATNWALTQSNKLTSYRILKIRPARVQGNDAVTVEYAYVADSPHGAASGALPAVMRATDTLVLKGEKFYILTFAAEKDDYAALTRRRLPRFRDVEAQILSSWRLP